MPRAKKPKPEVWWVQRKGRDPGWVLRVGGLLDCWLLRKSDVVNYARREARMAATSVRPIILRIRDRKGRVIAESSYCCDSKRRRG